MLVVKFKYQRNNQWYYCGDVTDVNTGKILHGGVEMPCNNCNIPVTFSENFQVI